jgi:hypothetical protein
MTTGSSRSQGSNSRICAVRRVSRYDSSVKSGRLGLLRAIASSVSKKVENLAQAVSLHYMHYNFARPHATLTKAAGGYPTTPAMAAGVANRVWTHRDIAALLD